MKVVFSQAAQADLESIGDYIARDNPRRAMAFVDELVDYAEQIVDAPEVFPSSNVIALAGSASASTNPT